MILFRQKTFTEYDAMRLLYTELKRDNFWRDRVRVVDRNSVISILRGNNILIERFVISSNFFGRDKYRLYLKIGAQANLPDEVRLPEVISQRRFLNAKIDIKPGTGWLYSKASEKLYSNKDKKNKDNKGNNNNNNGGGGGGNNPQVNSYLNNVSNGYDIMYEIRTLLADAIKYDKKDRSLVLEFDGPKEFAIRNLKEALNILPFGLEYNIYLLGV